MQNISITPSQSSQPQACAFFEDILAEHNIPEKIIFQINIAVDEIFSNISQYSGATSATLGCEITDQKILLRFADNGRPYDPTEQPEPDTTLSAEVRSIGGLGIYMVKKSMDAVVYEYLNGFNILTIEKAW